MPRGRGKRSSRRRSRRAHRAVRDQSSASADSDVPHVSTTRGDSRQLHPQTAPRKDRGSRASCHPAAFVVGHARERVSDIASPDRDSRGPGRRVADRVPRGLAPSDTSAGAVVCGMSRSRVREIVTRVLGELHSPATSDQPIAPRPRRGVSVVLGRGRSRRQRDTGPRRHAKSRSRRCHRHWRLVSTTTRCSRMSMPDAGELIADPGAVGCRTNLASNSSVPNRKDFTIDGRENPTDPATKPHRRTTHTGNAGRRMSEIYGARQSCVAMTRRRSSFSRELVPGRGNTNDEVCSTLAAGPTVEQASRGGRPRGG